MRNTKPSRVLKGLTSAKITEPPKIYAERPKLKGSRAKGITYERMVGRRLQERINKGEIPAELVSSQWFSFFDSVGPGYCQIDHYLICPGFIILIECKLTQSDSAPDQMDKLYRPILEMIYGVPVVCVQVCKNLRKYPPNAIGDITDLVFKPRRGIHTWHYLG